MHSLFSASGARKSDDAALTFLAQGIKAWLEAQLPKYAVIHPVQTSCLKNAVSSVEFLPELERGLAAAAATRAPAPDFGDDEELEEARRARPPPAPPPSLSRAGALDCGG